MKKVNDTSKSIIINTRSLSGPLVFFKVYIFWGTLIKAHSRRGNLNTLKVEKEFSFPTFIIDSLEDLKLKRIN